MSIDVKTLENKLREYKETSLQIKALDAKRKQLGEELLSSFPQGVKKYQTPHFKVFRQKRLSFKTTIEEAAPFKAIKTEVVIDKEKLKALHEEGQIIPGIKQIEYVKVNTLIQS